MILLFVLPLILLKDNSRTILVFLLFFLYNSIEKGVTGAY